MIKESSFDDSFLYTEGYRSGHNEAVLKTSACQFILFLKKPCIYKGFRTFPSCGISQFSRKVLAKIGVPTPPQFHTEGYRSGHNEAVLKFVLVIGTFIPENP